MARLSKYLNSKFIEASNALRPKQAKRKIVAYVESYDDISFWRTLLNEYESDEFHFEILLPARNNLTKGKKQAMMNMLGSAFGKNMIACVDSDYDYLLQGTTQTSNQIINSPYIIHTYTYAIENYRCYADNLQQVCVQSTLNDTIVFDMKAFMTMYSQIVHPLFVWNILLYRMYDMHTLPMNKFCEIVRLTSFEVHHPEHSLNQLRGRVNQQLAILKSRFSNLLHKYDELTQELISLGVNPEETYLYIQGHHIMDSVVLRMLLPVCNYLRRQRENEIERLAYHQQQYSNELSAYRNSQCDVTFMLKRNTLFQGASPYKKLKDDIEKLLKTL